MDTIKSSLKKMNSVITKSINVISPYGERVSVASTNSPPSSISSTFTDVFSKVKNSIKSATPVNNTVIYNNTLDKNFSKTIR